MNAQFRALDNKEFHRVFSCENAHEIWNKLEVVYEGTNQVKDSYEEDLVAEKGNEERKKKNIALKALKHESDEERELDDEDWL